jgi:5-methylcytosine-specific restriction endonuclease McrA
MRDTLDEVTRWAVWKRDGHRCVRCNSDTRLTVDHVVPVSAWGTNDLFNLRTLCRSCNSAKGARAAV